MRTGLRVALCAFCLLAFANSVEAHQRFPVAKRSKTPKKPKTGIEWDIPQESVVVRLNGRRVGLGHKLRYTRTRPGKHEVHLKRGGDEEFLEIRVPKGQVLKISYRFDD